MKTAYILENNLRVREVQVIREVSGSCLIKLKEGSGFWIHKSRVYYNIGETCNEIRKRQPDLSIEQVLQSDILKWDDNKYNAISNGL